MKLCECGCGKEVRRRFLPGHNPVNRSSPNRLAAVTTHGLSKTREYNRYMQAKARCNNSNNARYKDYGGRGVEFRFESFEHFFAELGVCPPNKTLDRIKNDGHYEIGNVRWATNEEQYSTRRPWKARCIHGLQPSRCFPCGGKQVCRHGTRPSRCKHRGEGGLCV